MEVDSRPIDISDDLDKQQDLKEGKRTKWQLPPSHISVFSSNTSTLIGSAKPKFSSYSRLPSSASQPETGQLLQDSARNSGTDERLTSTMSDDIVHDIDQKNSNGNEISLETIADALATPKSVKLSIMARAEICPKIKRARLMSTKGVAAKIRDQYGYDISNTTFLYAEETLYLLEMGRLEVHHGRVTLCAERARALFLHSKSHPFPDSNPMKIKTCSIDEYLVYKHLSELGYRVRRRDCDVKVNVSSSSLSASRERLTLSPLLSPPDNENVEMNTFDGTTDEGCRMELDEEECIMQQGDQESCVGLTGVITPQCLSSSSSGIGKSTIDGAACFDHSTSVRGVKRKFGDLSSDHTPGSATSSAKDMSDDDYADEELEFTHNNTVGDSCMDAASGGGDEDVSFFHPPTSNYTVTEADSDVEIMDEPVPGPSTSCSNGVYIEEIGHGYEGDIEDDASGASQEPQPSTSAACFAPNNNEFPRQAVVHLADSDSETEDFSIINKVWCKFVPNSTIQIGFPPTLLLPPNIPARDAIYEFDLTSRESTRSDSDLEYYVDELTLNSSPSYGTNNKSKNKGISFKSWKEWRQGAMTEAQEVLRESLLGQYIATGGIPMHKLYLWGENEPKCKKKVDEGWKGFNIPYEIYHPSVGFSKHKNRKDCPPCYVVAVVRYDEEVPSFAACDALVNGIPVLIAVVSDESTIMFVNPDGSPIPSLF